MLDKVIVDNLEANITPVLDGLKNIAVQLKKIRPEAESQSQQLLDAIGAINLDNTDVCSKLEALNSAVSAIKLDFPEISFENEAKSIVTAVESLQKTLKQKDFSTTVNIDVEQMVELLKKIAGGVSQKVVFPDTYPLPEEQLQKLLSGMDDKEQVSLLGKVIEAIKNIRVSGGGGPDVVGVKRVDQVTGRQTQVNPMREEDGAAIVSAIQNIVVPAPVGGATEAKQDTQVTQLEAIKIAVQNPPAPPAPVGGATEETLEDIDSEMDRILQTLQNVQTEPDSGEALSIDTNLRRVLGTETLVEKSKINTNNKPEYYTMAKNLPLIAGATMMMDVTGMSSLAIQISGTWTGTLTFECSLTGSDWQALNGMLVAGVAAGSTVTTNGIIRFNVAGIKLVQVRFTTATTGSPYVLMVASQEPSSIISNTAVISGAVTTTDSILPSSITTQAQPVLVAPVAPTLPAGGANNFLVNWFPQIFQRLRVESAGDKRVPFSQEENTWKQRVTDDLNRQILQDILRQLEILNNFTYQQMELNGHPNLKIPEGFKEE